MHGKTHENIRTVRPLRDGVIADFDAAEQMIRGMIKMANKIKVGSLILASGGYLYPFRKHRGGDTCRSRLGRTCRRPRCVHDFEPMAAALGIGLDVEAPEGNMIVDIGGGTTEIAVISLGGIVSNKSIKIAGDDFTEDIQDYMGRQHNIKVGDRTAEQIKINVGSVLTELDNPPEDLSFTGQTE